MLYVFNFLIYLTIITDYPLNASISHFCYIDLVNIQFKIITSFLLIIIV